MLNPYEIRKDFPILNRVINGHRIIYFDNAATSQKPVQVINAIKDFYEKHNANIHRSVHTLAQESTELYERAHEETAKFINADGMEEIVFVKNTTEAINLVAYSWGMKNLGEGDEVVVTLMDHHSNIVPWEILSRKRRFKLKFIDIKADGTLNYRELEEAVSNRTKIVCVPHVSNVLGVVNDVKRISKVAHEVNALILVDGAQSVPHQPVNVKELETDFLVFSGHKMLGPTGIGVLYGRRDILEEMEPFLGGGDMIREVKYISSRGKCVITWNDLPWKFEAGTPNIAGGIGLLAAIRYLREIGMLNVERHEKELVKHTLKRLEELDKTVYYGPRGIGLRSGIIAFNMNGLDSHSVAMLLDGYGIMVRSGFHCAQPLHQRMGIPSSTRASFYIYNTRDEVDRFIEALKEIELSELS